MTRLWQVINDSGLPVRRRRDGGQVHVELDLRPAAGYLDVLAEREERADVVSLGAVLAPRSIVVVGAGRSPDSVGHAVLANIVRAGFTGGLAAVNPHAGRVCGVVCERSVEDCRTPIDLAVVCVPARAVPETARQCGRAGVRALLVVSSGLSGEPQLIGDLLDAVRRYDMRLVGPNCIGISNTDAAVRLDATFVDPAPVGCVGLVTQSGGVTIAVQEELRRLGLGVSTAVSTGDKYDVSGNDMMLWWHHDPRTALAVLYMESFGNPRKFSRFARRLAERMPVLTVRSGSSDAGQRAAASHTASTATPRVTRDALFRQAGVLAVVRLDDLGVICAVSDCALTDLLIREPDKVAARRPRRADTAPGQRPRGRPDPAATGSASLRATGMRIRRLCAGCGARTPAMREAPWRAGLPCRCRTAGAWTGCATSRPQAVPGCRSTGSATGSPTRTTSPPGPIDRWDVARVGNRWKLGRMALARITAPTSAIARRAGFSGRSQRRSHPVSAGVISP